METQSVETPTSKIEIKTSEQFSINWRDIAQGLILAALTPALVLIQQSIDAGVFTFNWKPIAMSAVAGMVAYLLKKFLTPSQTIVTETKK